MEKLNSQSLKIIEEIVARHKDEMGPVKLMLHDVQHELGYIPFEAIEAIAAGSGVSVAEVYGVVTFYTQFTMEPKGEHVINICMGTACYVRGAQKLLDMISKVTGCPANQTTADRKFSVDATRCLGACGLAPIVVVDGKVFGKSSESNNLENHLKALVSGK